MSTPCEEFPTQIETHENVIVTMSKRQKRKKIKEGSVSLGENTNYENLIMKF